MDNATFIIEFDGTVCWDPTAEDYERMRDEARDLQPED